LDRRLRIKHRGAFNTRRYGGFRCRLRLRRLAEVIGGQRLKRRQRRIGVRTAGQQAQLIVAAHL
jgi:hypothetical protein